MARRTGLEITKKRVATSVKQRGKKQIFGATQPAQRKSVVPGMDTTLQMDLADMKNSPEVRDSQTY